MNSLKINKIFLKLNRPDLFELVKIYEKNNRYAKNIEWDEEHKEIKVKIGKKNIYLHSIYNKEREVKQLIKDKPKKVDQLCIFGLPEEKQFDIILNEFPLVKRIFIVVPSIGVFYKWLQYHFLENLYRLTNSRDIDYGELVFLIADDFRKIEDSFRSIVNVGQHEKLVIIPFLSYNNLYLDFFINVCNTTRIAMQDKNIMQETRKLWRNIWMLNNWTILGEKSVDILHLRNLFSNYPCIVVAAGASLEKNMHLLREVYNKAIIIAAGTAMSILSRNNIKPHFYIGVDGGDLCNKIFKYVDTEIPLLCSYSFYSPIAKEYEGNIFTFSIGSMDQIAVEIKKEIGEINLVSQGGLSVTNIAHSIALQLGCKKLIFMGQDCCYTRNKLYANGSWADGTKHSLKYNENEDEIVKEDIYGNKVITSEVLLGMNRAIINFVAANLKQCTFINATEGGLEIHGARNVIFKDFIENELNKSGDILKEIELIAKEKKSDEIHIKTKAMKLFADKYKNEMLKLENMLLKQKILISEIIDLGESKKIYKFIKESIEIIYRLEKNEFYLRFMKVNFILDINEVLMLDTGKYTYELLEGLKTVNKRLLEHVQAAIVLAEEFLEERAPLNRVIYVR